MTNIKSGYMLELTTWENDGDNYNTVRLDGLTKDVVRFYIAVTSLFGRDHGEKGFGNQPVWSSYETNSRAVNHNPVLDKLIADRRAANEYVPSDWIKAPGDSDDDDDDYFYGDLLGDLIGQTEYGHWRVLERFTVYYLPEVLRDISEQFR